MAKIYHVQLSVEERERLRKLLSGGKSNVRQMKRAQILLAADQGQKDGDIASSVQVSISTVERTRRKFVEGGVEYALVEKQRQGGQPKLDGKGEATLVALACSTPPDGYSQWTMQLLAGRLVEMGVVESISDETVRRRLKKTS